MWCSIAIGMPCAGKTVYETNSSERRKCLAVTTPMGGRATGAPAVLHGETSLVAPLGIILAKKISMIQLLITKIEIDQDNSENVRVSFADADSKALFDWTLPAEEATDFVVGGTCTVAGRETASTPKRRRAVRKVGIATPEMSPD